MSRSAPSNRQSRAALGILALLLAAACGAPAATLRGIPHVPDRQPLVDITHYDIAVDLHHESGLVDGHVDVSFQALPDRPATMLVLDAAEMQISSVTDDQGRELEYAQGRLAVEIRLAEALAPGQSAVVGIDYRAYPRRGLFFVAPNASDPDRPWQIWTQGQMHDTRHWMPVWDLPNDRATHTLAITVPSHFMTLAGGTRRSSIEHKRRGRRTDTWEMKTPHSSYLITLVAGELAEFDLGDGEVPLPVVAERSVLDHARANLDDTADMLAYFGEVTGRAYPYPKYAQVCVKEYTGGGMENISATTLTHDTLHDPADEPQVDSVDLLAHEAAHQWFGDLLTCRDWGHLWLNEGFATYYEALYMGRLYGDERFGTVMLGNQRAVVRDEKSNPHPIVWHGFENPDDMFDDHSYPGGASRLHLLSELLGADVFQRGVEHYVEKHDADVVVTDDFRVAMEEATGVPLQQFFDEWLYDGGFPKFRVTIGPQAVLHVEQTQGEDGMRDVFHLPVIVAWSRGGREHSRRIDVDERIESLPLVGTGQLDWVRFDSTTVVPGEIDLAQSEAMWRNQLRDAKDGMARLIAAQWFAKSRSVHWRPAPDWTPSDDSIAALVAAVGQDPFRDVRGTAVRALALTDHEHAAPTLMAALTDPDGIVRAAAANGLADVGGDEVLSALTNAADDSNGTVVGQALGSLSDRGFPGTFGMCAERFAATDRMRLKRDIVYVVSGLDDEPRALPFLLGAAARGADERVREAAISTLPRQGNPNGVVFRRLCEWLHDGSYRVRRAAAGALRQMGDPRAVPHLRARADIEVEPQVLSALERALNAFS